ncbi:hypothetical protein EJB05_44181, partial [Eragrostis curvula]
MMQDDTVNAAAVVLAAAARSSTGLLLHHQQVDDHACAAAKPRWWLRVKAKLLCFRPRHGHPHRIAAASPEPVLQSSSNRYCTHATQPTTVAFAAPPPSPASSSLFASQAASPAQVLRLDASSSYSSPTTASMFAIGPYAREPQQLVSPPAFSAGLTEPSTAPLTPPPEYSAGGLQLLAAGSSPEVPFARFLSPSFQGYQLQPGSPIGGTLVLSPASTSSSPPPWLRHRRDEEGPSLVEAGGEEGCGARRKPSGEFVFGSAAGEWTTTFADADGGERRSSTSMADDAAEGGNRQWPFSSSLPS